MKRYFTCITILILSFFLSSCEKLEKIINKSGWDYSTVSFKVTSSTYGIEDKKFYSQPQYYEDDAYQTENWIGSNYLYYSRELYCKVRKYSGRIKFNIDLKNQLFKTNQKYPLDTDSKQITITIYNNRTGEEIVLDDITSGYIILTEYDTRIKGNVSGYFEIQYADNTTITNGTFENIRKNDW